MEQIFYYTGESMKFKDKIARFMYGRYGMDQLSRFLVIAAMVALVISMFVGGVLHAVVWVLGVAALVWCYVRILSKNFDKRRSENNWYLNKKNIVTRWFRSLKDRWSQRREYKFFRCPQCKALLRVPRGKGRIQLSCRQCGHRFERKS